MMAWYGWLSLAVSLLGYVMTWRRVTYMVAWNSASRGGPDAEDWIFGVVIGAMIALAWPVIVPVWYARKLIVAFGLGSSLVAVVAKQPKPVESKADRIKRLERERREREAYIARLEREVGIT